MVYNSTHGKCNPVTNSNLLQQLVNVFLDPFCIIDKNFTIIAINRAFLSLLKTPDDQVICRDFDLVFSGFSCYDKIKKALTQISEQDKYQSVIECFYPGNHTRSLMITVTSLNIGLLLSSDGIEGFSIQVREDGERNTHQLQLVSEHLISIISEIQTIIAQSGYSSRLIQHLINRLGPVLKTQYISFFEIIERGESKIVHEISLWSVRYGYLIGEVFDDISLSDTAGLISFLEKNPGHSSLSYSLQNAPAVLQPLMMDREVIELQIFPVIHDHTAGGCLILWGTPSSVSQSNRTLLHLISGMIGESQIRLKNETKLVRIEEKFRGVIEDIGDMYYRTDKAGVILEVSPSMVSSLEYVSSSDLIGLNLENLLQNPDIWPLFLSDVLHQNGVKDYELVYKGNHGKIITGSVSCRLIYDEEGFLRGSEGVIRDISRRRQYEQLVQESEWKLEEAQKIAKLGVWSYDNKSRIFRVSSEIFSLLNIPAEISLITLDDLIVLSSTEDKTKFSQYFDQMVKGGNEFGFEFKIDLPGEKFKYIRIKGQPRIRGGVVNGSFGILQDITERKEVEQHLLKYAYQLEQKTMELDAMRTQLLDMNRELDKRVRRRTTQIEDLLRQKDEFIMQIGHDLKTPLTPLVAILPIIRKKITDPEIGELLDISIEDVQSIKKMIVTILELAKMNALYTVSDLDEIFLNDALDQIISDNAYLIHQKSLTIKNEIPSDLIVKISPMHLETLMTNLIGNAVKYSYIEGEIIISGYEKRDSVVIVIRDHGIGIEPEILPRIFDSFFKADLSRHDRESHGLGLAIAQRVVDIYGGSIKAESEGSGKGSTFSVMLKKNPPIENPMKFN